MPLPRGSTPLNGARVLILEDEFVLADDLARAVCDAGGEPVGPASSVEQATQLVARERPDAAILDLNLRGEMASDFIRGLRAINLPCLIVSGYGEDALPAFVSDIPRIEKPASPSLVIEALAAEWERVD
jgi:DNA-binding response OmpR family regulator